MRTWWIVKTIGSGLLMISEHGHRSLVLDVLPHVGPFWSYEEAQRVLDHWTK